MRPQSAGSYIVTTNYYFAEKGSEYENFFISGALGYQNDFRLIRTMMSDDPEIVQKFRSAEVMDVKEIRAVIPRV